MIDIKNAKEVFANYAKKFDSANGKITLKIRHMYRVAEVSKDIATKLGLNEEQQNLAELIGLLHDIGRFEQIKIYNTFNDSKSENHAAIGVRILFDEGLIKDFIKTREYDEIIKIAILNHNRDKDKMDTNLDEQTELFCKIIRDADKLDILYFTNIDPIEDVYEVSDLSNDLVTDEIYREFMEDNCIDYSKRQTAADTMVGQLVYIFDFNFGFNLTKVKECKYLEKMIERANYKNEETINKFKKMLELANKFMEES